MGGEQASERGEAPCLAHAAHRDDHHGYDAFVVNLALGPGTTPFVAYRRGRQVHADSVGVQV
jgi:hypothetical protein